MNLSKPPSGLLRLPDGIKLTYYLVFRLGSNCLHRVHSRRLQSGNKTRQNTRNRRNRDGDEDIFQGHIHFKLADCGDTFED